jgi:hypothetical protein
LLDLDKGDQQAIDSAPEAGEALGGERDIASGGAPPRIVDVAQAFMRESGAAIRDLPIVERKPPEAGTLTGRAVAATETHVAVATASNSFVILQLNAPAPGVQVGDKIAVRVQQGRATIEQAVGRDR